MDNISVDSVIVFAIWFCIGFLLIKLAKVAYVYFYYTRNFVPGRSLTARQRWWLTRAYFRAEQDNGEES